MTVYRTLFVWYVVKAVVCFSSFSSSVKPMEVPPREVSLEIMIDARKEIIRVKEDEHVATKCAKFCGEHRLDVDNCYILYRELSKYLFALPNTNAKPTHEPPDKSVAYISSPRSQQYYPASQRIYFLLNLSSTTLEETSHKNNVYDKFYDFNDYENQDFCVSTDYTPGAASAWCGKLPYDEPLYTQPNTFSPGIHMLHILNNGEILHSLFFSRTLKFFRVEHLKRTEVNIYQLILFIEFFHIYG